MIRNSHKNLVIIKLLYIVFFVVIFWFVYMETKRELHLAINSYHSSFFDIFFKYITHLGDGIMFGVLVVLFFFKNKRVSLIVAFSGILTLLLTGFFKKIVFKGMPRPIEFFGKDNALHLIEGVKMAHWNSFPSGHTMAAFAIATVLIYTTTNFYLRLLYLLLAILAGFSRVYLSQHFMMDILAGSALGIFAGLLSIRIVEVIEKRRQRVL